MKLSHAIKDIVEIIPEYPSMKQTEKDWLLQHYVNNYKKGMRSVRQDTFTNENNMTSHAISERVNEFPEIKLSDTSFLEKLAEENVESLDSVLKKYGDKEDFIYEVYEENYMGRVPSKIDTGKIPKEFEQYNIAILLQEAYSQGVIYTLDILAKKYIVNYAKKMLKK